MASEPEDRPRGLWGVMRRGEASLTSAPPGEQQSASTDGEREEIDREPAESELETEPAAGFSGKGLWAMMGVRPRIPVQPPREKSISEKAEPIPPPAWFRGKGETEPLSEPEPPSEKPIQKLQPMAPSPAKPKPRPVPRQEPFIKTAVETPAQEKLASLTIKTGRSRGAMFSFLAGLFAMPVSLLAMRPEIWTRFPAAVVGFGALVLGLISYSEIQRSRGKQTGKGLAMLGMLLGTVAMFMGPLVIAPWSENQNRTNTRSITKSHLESISKALGRYHAQYDQFPPGGTYRIEKTGETTALHSWMTHLLPYLGANETYHEIRLNDPWSEPLNRPPLGKEIPAFLAGGVEETHNRAGYGLSHFAGVGGRVEIAEGHYVNAGIFERDSNVRQSDVTDGLSQTLIAGEIPEGYRPWGEPGNWRTVGEGLNKGSTSFGNAERTGAMFLKADGSVEFYSNSIAPDVLKRLSTRDGEDNRMIPEKYR